MTLPLFFPFLWSLCGEKNAAGLCTPPRWLFSLLAVAVFSALSVLFVSRIGSPAHKLTNFPPDDLCPQTSASPRLFTVEAFQTHLEGREWHSIPWAWKPARISWWISWRSGYGDPSQRRKYAARKSESPVEIHQEDFRCRVVDHQRAATRAVSRISVTSSLLASAGAGIVTPRA